MTEIELIYDDKTYNFSLPFIDTASIENAMHVSTYCLTNELMANEIQNYIPQWETISMRLETVHGNNGNLIVSDFYSNDLLSLSISLQYLNQKSESKKKIVFLSDILESDESIEVLYRKIAKELDKTKSMRYIVGDNIIKLSSYFHRVKVISDLQKSVMKIEPDQFKDSLILLKGARKYTFEKLLPF